ncbi:MAG TPA: hypothetical protein VMX16_02060 [Terriglobia bacterium]|nr:hypothetical protein [Terriglobia bacterium]
MVPTIDKTKIHQGPGNLWVGVAIPMTGSRLLIDPYGNPTQNALGAPPAPTLTQAPGGTQPAQTCYVKITYVNPVGETIPSSESSLAIAVDNLLVVASPLPSASATGWNIYAASSSGAEKLQNGSPIPIGQNWIEAVTGLSISGNAPPAANTAGPLFAGAVAGAATVLWTPKVNTITADQVTAPIDARLVSEEETIEAEIMETDYARFKAYISSGLFSTGADPGLPLGFQSYEEISFGGLMMIPQMSVAVVSPRQEAPGKFVVSQLYNAYQAQALSMPFSREKPTTVKIKFNGLADPMRPVGDQVGKVYRQP